MRTCVCATADQHLLAESCVMGESPQWRGRLWLFGPRQWHHPRGRDHHPHQRHPHDIGDVRGDDQATSCWGPV